MAIQYSTEARNAQLDALETLIGLSAVLKIRTGAPPANVAAADTGTVLATLTLPSDWMAAAGGGSKAKAGVWQDASADNAGTPGHFRIYASDGVTAHIQGTCGLVGVTPDLVVSLSPFSAGQSIVVDVFSLIGGNG